MADHSYKISVFDEGVNSDVILGLHEEIDGDLHLLKEVNDTQGNGETIEVLRGDTDGLYRLRLRHANPVIHGIGTRYKIKVTDETGGIPGILMVLIHDRLVNDRLLSGDVTAPGIDSFDVVDNVYMMDVAAGTYDIAVSVNGYGPNPALLPAVVEEDQLTEVHFFMDPISVRDLEFVLKKGWNLISFPYIPLEKRAGALFQENTQGGVWFLDNKILNPVKTVNPLTGYWLYCPAEEPLPVLIRGVDLTDGRLHLDQGWYILGPITDNDWPATLPGLVWYWDGTMFRRADSLKPGQGYLIHSQAPTTIEWKVRTENE